MYSRKVNSVLAAAALGLAGIFAALVLQDNDRPEQKADFTLPADGYSKNQEVQITVAINLGVVDERVTDTNTGNFEGKSAQTALKTLYNRGFFYEFLKIEGNNEKKGEYRSRFGMEDDQINDRNRLIRLYEHIANVSQTKLAGANTIECVKLPDRTELTCVATTLKLDL